MDKNFWLLILKIDLRALKKKVVETCS